MSEREGAAGLAPFLARLPLVAILRGIEPGAAAPVGRVLVAAGFAILEVPLNSPRPFESIRELADAAPDALVGAGTVRTPADVDAVAAAGGRLIVMPHGDRAVIAAAKSAGLLCVPGVATPTEGFAALDRGADALKLFPAELLGPAVVKAWRSVFPRRTVLLPVGGIGPESMAAFVAAGADGFGIGSALFVPGRPLDEIGRRAEAFAAAWRGLRGSNVAAT